MKSSFKPFLDLETKALFIGTLPSETSLKQQQYYAHPQNKFWKLLYDVFHEPYDTNYENRLKFLTQHHLGLWDVICAAERKGSLDQSIKKFRINDFDLLLKHYPQLTHFYFTSKQAYQWYASVYKNTLPVNCLVLSSPSPANARMSYVEKLKDWQEKIMV